MPFTSQRCAVARNLLMDWVSASYVSLRPWAVGGGLVLGVLLESEVPFSLFAGPSFSSATVGRFGRFRVTMDTSFPSVHCPAPPTWGTNGQAHLLMMSFNVAKCYLGKIKLKAMLSGSLWMQETRLQPLAARRDISRCLYVAAHYRWPHKAWGGPGPSQGPLVTFTRSVLFAVIRKLISLAQSLARSKRRQVVKLSAPVKVLSVKE